MEVLRCILRTKHTAFQLTLNEKSKNVRFAYSDGMFIFSLITGIKYFINALRTKVKKIFICLKIFGKKVFKKLSLKNFDG